MINDFGLSRMFSASQSFSASLNSGGLNGTVRWMAYELFQLEDVEPEHTKASDVWAYGMTIYVSAYSSYWNSRVFDATFWYRNS